MLSNRFTKKCPHCYYEQNILNLRCSECKRWFKKIQMKKAIYTLILFISSFTLYGQDTIPGVTLLPSEYILGITLTSDTAYWETRTDTISVRYIIYDSLSYLKIDYDLKLYKTRDVYRGRATYGFYRIFNEINDILSWDKPYKILFYIDERNNITAF
jgi:hypothetical protein